MGSRERKREGDRSRSRERRRDRSRSRERERKRERKERSVERVKTWSSREKGPLDPTRRSYHRHGEPREREKTEVIHERLNTAAPKMIEVICNDRMGKKTRVKCTPSDKIGDLKRLLSA